MIHDGFEMDIKQTETARGLDALIILGGGTEKEDHSRTNHAIEIYKRVMKSRKNPLYIIPSGYWSGMSNEIPEKAESELMKEYLISKSVPNDVIIKEDKSKDTLTNFIFSWSILDLIDTKKIGIITDKYHITRANWSGKKVFGKKYLVEPLPNDNDKIGLFDKAIDRAVWTAQYFDTLLIESGNKHAWVEYLLDKHPFYSENPKPSFYLLGVKAMRALKK